jgi:cytochrome c5
VFQGIQAKLPIQSGDQGMKVQYIVLGAIAILCSSPLLASDGKEIYTKTCAACHAAGVANAPKLGDKAAWAPRIKTGRDALVASVVKGKGVMPPKAGNASLSEGDIKTAVDYILSQAK